MITRRDWIRATLSGGAVALLTRSLPALGLSPRGAKPKSYRLTVYKSPTCGCCQNWVAYMKRSGFVVDAHDVSDDKLAEIKSTAGVPEKLRSCHTALVGQYAFEGHVPADLALKVLREKPTLVALAVPGMPVGSPGMEVGNQKQPYEIMAVARDGKSWVYARR
jgi:hypothetical protein